MSQPIVEQDDIDLNFIREKRKGLVDKLTAKGIPDDPEQQSIMLKALSDMSRDAIAKKRIKSEEKIASGNSANTAMVAAFLSKFNPNNMQQPALAGSIPVLDLPRPTLVDGETEIKTSSESFETFTARMGMS